MKRDSVQRDRLVAFARCPIKLTLTSSQPARGLPRVIPYRAMA